MSSRISPTAHYTGYVWARNGLSHSKLSTPEGRLLFESLRPMMIVSTALGGASLERYLLARHLAIDRLLEQAIDQDGVRQVIEVACGLSPRGWRFTKRYGSELTYVEADLPEMAARKRDALEEIGSTSRTHRVEEIDALAEDGPTSIGGLAAQLDPGHGLAIVTEGLLGYLPFDDVNGIWHRFAHALRPFSVGRYVSDLHIGELQSAQVRAFRVLLSGFVRGRVHLHFQNAAEAQRALRAAGFGSTVVSPAAELSGGQGDRGSRLAHVLEATV
jgi:O-methyltransferase involved in polyketide biosynthesis